MFRRQKRSRACLWLRPDAWCGCHSMRNFFFAPGDLHEWFGVCRQNWGKRRNYMGNPTSQSDVSFCTVRDFFFFFRAPCLHVSSALLTARSSCQQHRFRNERIGCMYMPDIMLTLSFPRLVHFGTRTSRPPSTTILLSSHSETSKFRKKWHGMRLQ